MDSFSRRVGKCPLHLSNPFTQISALRQRFEQLFREWLCRTGVLARYEFAIHYDERLRSFRFTCHLIIRGR